MCSPARRWGSVVRNRQALTMCVNTLGVFCPSCPVTTVCCVTAHACNTLLRPSHHVPSDSGVRRPDADPDPNSDPDPRSDDRQRSEGSERSASKPRSLAEQPSRLLSVVQQFAMSVTYFFGAPGASCDRSPTRPSLVEPRGIYLTGRSCACVYARHHSHKLHMQNMIFV